MERVAPSRRQRAHHRASTAPARRWWRAGCTPPRSAPTRPLDHGQRGRAGRGRVRERALRPRARRLHRREDRPRRLLRAGRRRHALPRRDRQHADGAAGQAAARACRRASSTPVGSSRGEARGRAGDRGHQRATARRGGRGALPRGPALPAQHGGDAAAPAARAARGHSADLAQLFLGASQSRAPPQARHASPPTRWRRCCAHPWPGNVRELEHAVERAVLLASGEEIAPTDLFLGADRAGRRRCSSDMTLDEAERHLIQRALARCGGNVSEAARALGLSRSALYRRSQHHGLQGLREASRSRSAHDQRVFLLSLAAGLPAVVASLALLWLDVARGQGPLDGGRAGGATGVALHLAGAARAGGCARCRRLANLLGGSARGGLLRARPRRPRRRSDGRGAHRDQLAGRHPARAARWARWRPARSCAG